IYGNDPYGDTWRQLASVPEADRKYLSAMLQVTDADERKKIMEATPAYMQRILSAQWAMQDADAGNLSQGDLSKLKRIKTASWLTQQVRLSGKAPDLDRYFQENYLPPAQWSGWAVDEPIEAAEAKLVENEGQSVQEYGIWQSEVNRFRRLD